MEISLPPELEKQIAILAASRQRTPEAVLAELVEAALWEDGAFRVLEKQIAMLAASRQRAPEAVLAELVEAALWEDGAFRVEVQAGLAELDEGKSVSHDEAMARLRDAVGPYGARPQ